MSPGALITLGIIGLIFAWRKGWLPGVVSVHGDKQADDSRTDEGDAPLPALAELQIEVVDAQANLRSAEERWTDAVNAYESALLETKQRAEKALGWLKSETAPQPDKQPDKAPDETTA